MPVLRRRARLLYWQYAGVLVAVTMLAVGAKRIEPDRQVSFTPSQDMMLSQADLPSMFAVWEGATPSPAIRDRSPFLVEIKRSVLLDNFSRAFMTPQRSEGVTLSIVQVGQEGSEKWFLRSEGRRDEPPPGAPTDWEFGVVLDEDNWTEREVLWDGPGIAVYIRVWSSGENSNQTSLNTLLKVAQIQASRLSPPRGVSAATEVDTSRLSVRLLLGEIAAITALAAALALITMLRDRAGWQRFTDRMHYNRTAITPPGFTESVAQQSRAIRGQYRDIGLLSYLVIVAALSSAAVLGNDIRWSLVIFLTALLVHGLATQRLAAGHVTTGAAMPTFGGWAVLPGALLTLVSLALLAGGIVAIWVVIVSDLVGAPGSNEDQVRYFQATMRIIGLILIALSSIPLFLARKVASLRFGKTISHDTRRGTLLLRSFADDGLMVRSRGLGRMSLLDRITMRRRERFEEVVARTVMTIGPIRALSDPGTTMQPLGAVRETCDDDTWKARIYDLIGESALIVVFVARTEHCAHELRDIAARGALPKSVFIIPPVGREERRRRLHVLARMLNADPRSIDWEEPGRSVLAVVFHPDRGAIALTSDGPDDVSYQLAVLRAQELLAHSGKVIVPDRPTLVNCLAPVEWKGRSALWGPGEAPKVRRWWRKTWALAVGLIVVSQLASACVALAPASPTPFSVIDTDVLILDMVQSSSDEKVFALGFDGSVLKLDIAQLSALPIGGFSTRMAEPVATDNWLAALSQSELRIGAINLASGEVWESDVEGTPTGLAISGGQVIATFPAQGAVRFFDLTTGALEQEILVDGGPWSVATSEDRLYITLVVAGQIAVLDRSSFAILDRLDMPIGPTMIHVENDRAWIQTAQSGSIATVDLKTGAWRLLAGSAQVFPALQSPESATPTVETAIDPTRIDEYDMSGNHRCKRTVEFQLLSRMTTTDGVLLSAPQGYNGILVHAPCG